MSIKAKLTQGGDGTAIPAGMVGETIVLSTLPVDTTSVGAGAWARSATKIGTLTKGSWLVYGTCTHTVSGATNHYRYGISTATTSSPSNGTIVSFGADSQYNTNSTNAAYMSMNPALRFDVTADTDLYAWAFGEDTSGNGIFTGIGGIAQRIA